ncbi:unnamed protein product [Strongylus vulgaris]|uniref:DDE Tnp4 domain-containing protein n=1 Tax=Strongylus vulgaris TaxID=40348 RepID=A0A3P7J9U3_STRVU|nr:unnamed protein product [Strongylus vulgaris]
MPMKEQTRIGSSIAKASRLTELAAVDTRGGFVYVNANFPGCVHDASIYACPQVKSAQEGGAVLRYCLGDCGFANGNDIITLIKHRPGMKRPITDSMRRCEFVVDVTSRGGSKVRHIEG